MTTATISADGSSVVWFSDPTGDESGRWLAVPFEGGEPRDVFPGAPDGWPEGLALGRELAVAVIADRERFRGARLRARGSRRRRSTDTPT